MSKKFKKVFEISSPSCSKFVTACLGKTSGDYILCSDENKFIYLYKRGFKDPFYQIKSNSLTTCVYISEENIEFFIGSQGGLIQSFDLNNGKSKYSLNGHSMSISAMTSAQKFESSSIFNEISLNCNKLNDNIFASGAVDGKIKIWDVLKLL